MSIPSLAPRLTNLLKHNSIEVVWVTAGVVNGIVCNSRMDKGVMRFARSGDLLGQLRTTLDTIVNAGAEDSMSKVRARGH